MSRMEQKIPAGLAEITDNVLYVAIDHIMDNGGWDVVTQDTRLRDSLQDDIDALIACRAGMVHKHLVESGWVWENTKYENSDINATLSPSGTPSEHHSNLVDWAYRIATVEPDGKRFVSRTLRDDMSLDVKDFVESKLITEALAFIAEVAAERTNSLQHSVRPRIGGRAS